MTGWRITVHDRPAAIPAAHWNALLDASPQPTPFMRHEWLQALDDTDCARPESGWTPVFLSARGPDAPDDAPPDGVAALYVKTHSYGEYVFDWAWARAHEEAGLPYYPKLLAASPFTPVPGSRLLGKDQAARGALLGAMRQLGQSLECSSAHLLFPDELDRHAAQEAGWLMRQGVQFHWHNRHALTPEQAPYADFADFLGHLHRDKRKKIGQERRRVLEAGVTVVARRGREISPQDWAFFYRCYRHTYLAHGGPPYLSEAFFKQVAHTMPENWLLFIAERDGEPIAASLLGIDTERGVAWGRYWGALQHIPCLHFELCYYSPLAWSIEQRFACFEGGAQGEHKLARGLLPVTTWSAHWLKDARFADAVSRFLAREGAGMDAYVDELRDRMPFKPLASAPDASV
jgi:predicted N-acyltransferase